MPVRNSWKCRQVLLDTTREARHHVKKFKNAALIFTCPTVNLLVLMLLPKPFRVCQGHKNQEKYGLHQGTPHGSVVL